MFKWHFHASYCPFLRALCTEWRLNEASSEAPVLYKRLIWWFLDLPDSSEHLFSIHQLVQEGRKLDVPVGQWYGPTTIAQAIQYVPS